MRGRSGSHDGGIRDASGEDLAEFMGKRLYVQHAQKHVILCWTSALTPLNLNGRLGGQSDEYGVGHTNETLAT